jgi:tetratricopeptide (TPR) repeat protein
MGLTSARRRWIARLLQVVGIVSVSFANVAGAQTTPAVGTRVVIKAGATLKVGDTVVDTGKSHRIYNIERTNGDWLWLVSGPAAGWAKSADVIPLEEAIARFTAEIERDPKIPASHFNRGLIHQDQRNFGKAISDYGEAIRRDPRFVPALINRGNVLQALKAYDKAIADYDQAIEADSKQPLAFLNRGNARLAKREYDKAIADYDEAISLGLMSPSAYNNRGHARELKREYDSALTDYDAAIRLDPRYVLAWLNRGNVRKTRGEFDKALADYAEVIRIAPTSPDGYSRRAWILATCPSDKTRDGKEAVALAEKACELSNQKDPAILDVRAAAHAEVGDFARAVYWENKAIELTAKIAPTAEEGYRAHLKRYHERKPYRDEK